MIENDEIVGVVEPLLDIVKSVNAVGEYHRNGNYDILLYGKALDGHILDCLKYLAEGKVQWAMGKIDDMKAILGQYLTELED